jgi:predicted double-glycine peptidase
VKGYEKVGDFARTLLNIMQMKDASPSQVNLLMLGKTLNHEETFND